MSSDFIYSKLPAPLEENYAWQAKGKCVGEDTEIFFLPYAIRGENKRKRIAQAKAICVGCSVLEECLNYSLDTEQEFGVWGGVSEDERKVLLRRRGA